MSSSTSRGALLAASLLAAAAVPAASAQVEYEIVSLPAPAGALLTQATDLSEAGHVVGYAQFSAAPSLRAWVWTPEQGITVLPQPPELSTYRAMGINEAGTIAGDGGIDFGRAWRFENGAYEDLGTLDGDPISLAAAINASGAVAGTSKGLSFNVPPDSFLAPRGGGPALVQPSSQATFLNDTDQVVGWTTSLSGFRYTPGAGVEILPPLGQHVQVFPFSINASGAVVGSASHANGNASVPFLYTDTDGMQEIGSFGGGSGAADVTDGGVVVGTFSVGGDHPWIWTAATGIRFLDDLIDPASGLTLLAAKRINESGVVLARAADLSTFQRFPVLLVPIRSDPGTASCFGDGCPCGNDDPGAGCANSSGTGALLSGAGSAGVAADDLVLTATNVPAFNQGLFYMGDTQLQVPFFDGKQCALGTTFRFLGSIQSSGAGGTMTLGPGIAADAGGLITAGGTWHFHAWHRDVPGSPCGTGANLSNLYSVTYTP